MLQYSRILTLVIVSSLLTMKGYSSDPWNPDPAVSIPNSSGSSSPSVFSSCDSSGNFLATWLNGSGNVPYYSIYSSSWSTPSAITGASAGAPGTIVFSSFDSSTGNFLVTWQNGSDNTPYFSIYDGSSWSTPAQISTSNTSSDVFCSSDGNGHFLATWIDATSHFPYYAIYTENSSTWGGPTSIPGSSFPTGGDVVSSYDSSTGNFLVTWVNANGNAYYAVYNQTTWTITTTQIPNVNNNYTHHLSSVFSSSDSQGNFLVTWHDNHTHKAAYSIYDSSNLSWSSPTFITNSAVDQDVTSSFDSSTGNFMITWQDNTSTFPYYSIYNPSTSPQYTAQSPIAPINPIPNIYGWAIFSSCYTGSGNFLVTFTDSHGMLYYTFYNVLSKTPREFQRGPWIRTR